MSEENSIVVSTNYWRIPSVQTAFDGLIEGSPTSEERLQIIARAEADRCGWTPSPEAMDLVERLKAFIGCRVQIQFWDPCMFMLEEEGPFPLNAICKGVTLLLDDGFLQAYLELSDTGEQPNADGYSPMSYLKSRPESKFQLAPLANLYSITKI